MKISLTQHVKNWIADKAQGYEGDQLAVLKDLQRGGCQSGMVNHLVYSSDCRDFVTEYMMDIQEIINEIEENTGDRSFLFDKDGLFTFDRMAWVAFEYVAFDILNELENEEIKMTQSKHTPGPWLIDNGQDNIVDRAGRCIVNMHSIHGHDVRNMAYKNPKQFIAHDDGGKANANLIAAAPELLEALEYGLSWLSTQIEEELDDSLPCIWIEKARAAIAKAKGES